MAECSEETSTRWREEEVMINMWQERRVLWDITDPDYKNIRAKQLAREEIAQAIGKTNRQVKDKLKNLNDSYVKARKRLREVGAAKPGSRDVYLLERLQFLLPSKVAPGSKSASENFVVEKVEEADNSCLSDDHPVASSSRPSASSSRKRRMEDNVTSNGDVNHSVTDDTEYNNKSEEDYFSQYIGAALKGLEPTAKQWCMMEMHSALYKARTGIWEQSLSEHH
ncbi:uncharacterized protein LOC101863507 isoform X2 [Aplysia californica]|uniref:Uncharacterized protein LOC101863507 isoform X2 n=1 Tax=Aplysia californica TaxID=6500 RepID=A0ABM0JMR0_APLCA|nr:uncharacterized protein LOC101863507 isoform X2 [Aplysia californica]